MSDHRARILPSLLAQKKKKTNSWK
jgi:hypothetical protein